MKKRLGFSLIELLLTISLIGLIVAIVVPNMSSLTKSAQYTQNFALAKAIVNVYKSGVAAGVEWQGDSKKEIVQDVIQGRAPTKGPFKGKTFGLPDNSGNALSEEVLAEIEFDSEKQLALPMK